MLARGSLRLKGAEQPLRKERKRKKSKKEKKTKKKKYRKDKKEKRRGEEEERKRGRDEELPGEERGEQKKRARKEETQEESGQSSSELSSSEDEQEVVKAKGRDQDEDDEFLNGLTPSQRKFELMRRKREQEQISKMISKTHREKMNEFNEKLSKQTDFNDIPKVSSAGNG